MSVKRRNLRPLNPPRLEEMALAYVARFATTQAKLRVYLKRKLRERGWEGDDEPPVEQLVERYVQLGYVDDESWARMKAGSLLRRGYGARRVNEALAQGGVASAVSEELAPREADEREAALVLARRRRFGPFSRTLENGNGECGIDRSVLDKQLAAMMRAGHSLDIARHILEARDAGEAEDWVAEARDGEGF